MKTKILITSVLLVFGLLIQPMISKAETTPFEKAISKTSNIQLLPAKMDWKEPFGLVWKF